MEKKTYLEITPFFPTVESFRGPYIYDQVKAIERNSDFDVKVIKMVSIFSKEPSTYEYQGVRVFNFKVWDLPSSAFPGLFHSINLHRFEDFLKTVVQVPFEQIAFIHTHVAYPAGALGIDVGRKYNIKTFVQHHGLDVMQLSNGRLLKGGLKKLSDALLKRRFLKTVNNADLNIGVSQKVLDQLEQIDGFQNPKQYVLYNGVDTTKFYKKANVQKDEKNFTIGCIGNFWKIKDQITLLKALDILVNEKEQKNIRVIFVGSGPTLEECKRFVAEKRLGPYVEFKNEIDHTKLNDFYNSLDLFVLPSYYEALGCVYTEALQVGVPIVAVKGQGIEEILSKQIKKYSLIQKGDYQKLVDQIVYHRLKRFRKEVFLVYNFNIDVFIQTFLKEVKKTS